MEPSCLPHGRIDVVGDDAGEVRVERRSGWILGIGDVMGRELNCSVAALRRRINGAAHETE